MNSTNGEKLHWPTVLIPSIVSLVPSMTVATLGMALPDVRKSLALSEVEAGALFSTIFIVAVVASAVAGRLSDKIGRKAVLVTGIASLSLGFALSGLSPSYALMLALLAFAGLGYGFTTPSLYALMSDLLPGRRGFGASLVSVSYGLGGLVGSVLSSSVIAGASWRAAFATVGLFGVTIALLETIAIRSPSSRQSTCRQPSYWTEMNRTIVLLAFAEFFGGSVFWSTASWAATVMRTDKELSLGETGFVMGVWGLTPMIGALLLGTLSDRFGRKRVILWSAFPAAMASFIVYFFLKSPLALALGLLLFGTLKASVPTLIIALAQDSASADGVGTASGVVMSMHYVAAVAAPILTAQLMAGTGNMVLTMVLTSSLPLIIYGSLILGVRERPHKV